MPSEKKFRMDVPYERLHQTVVAACQMYEAGMRRKRKRVTKITIVYSPEEHPYYDVKTEEVDLGVPVPRKSRPIDVGSDEEA